WSELEQTATDLLQQYQVPGCIIAIAKRGEIVYEKSFGYRDVANKKQINADTVFGLASLTKSFTCAAIMKLVEAGKIALTSSVVGYLPELRIKKTEKLSEMTIAHFITHEYSLHPHPSLDLALDRTIIYL